MLPAPLYDFAVAVSNCNCNWKSAATGDVTVVDVAAASAWLSDVDEGSSTQQRVDVVLLSECGDDRPSVGSSPRQTDESSSPEQPPHKPQLPRVDYMKGLGFESEK